ncbi:MAG: LysR family transcriptional regulator [Moraxella equi]|nr:LysR family transcriptional regulator [Moraxella equi]
MHRINLNDFSLFVTVVQAGSFSKAAEITNIPKSRLSRRISHLEENLGITLMGRGKKGVVLNDAGEEFYLHALEMIQTAEHAISHAQGRLDKPSGLLRMSVSTEVGRGILIHHLAEYMARYPDVTLKIEINNKKINMIQDGMDISLRLGKITDENVVARKWLEIETGLFASTDYLERMGTPQSPHELYHHQLLYKYDGPEWYFHYKHHEVHINNKNRLNSNDANLLGKMVADGMGISLLPILDNMVMPNMQRILPEWRTETVPLYIIYYKNRSSTPALQSMVNFLLNIDPFERTVL